MLLVRRFLAPPGGFLGRLRDAGDIFSTAGTGLAVVLGFVIFLAFGSYQSARDASSREAVAVQQMYDVSAFFAEPQRDSLEGDTVCYARSVVHDEWPAMSHNRESPEVLTWSDRLNKTIHDVPISSQRDQAALSHWYDESSARQEGRLGRLAEAAPLVPTYLWLVLALLALVVLSFLGMFADPEAGALGLATAMGTIARTVFGAFALIWTLDRPFSDRGAAISPSSMQRSLDTMSRTFAGTSAVLPCDSTGSAR